MTCQIVNYDRVVHTCLIPTRGAACERILCGLLSFESGSYCLSRELFCFM